MLFVSLKALCFYSVESDAGLVFKNAVLESGVAGADGGVYRFSDVSTNIDALVKITGRSGSLVTLVSIDINSSGWDKAFQPEVTYNNGTATGVADWWMEFEISFVENKGLIGNTAIHKLLILRSTA